MYLLGMTTAVRLASFQTTLGCPHVLTFNLHNTRYGRPCLWLASVKDGGCAGVGDCGLLGCSKFHSSLSKT